MYLNIFLISYINNNATQFDKLNLSVTDNNLKYLLKNSKYLKIYLLL